MGLDDLRNRGRGRWGAGETRPDAVTPPVGEPDRAQKPPSRRRRPRAPEPPPAPAEPVLAPRPGEEPEEPVRPGGERLVVYVTPAQMDWIRRRQLEHHLATRKRLTATEIIRELLEERLR
jgi:hypothetical protein